MNRVVILLLMLLFAYGKSYAQQDVPGDLLTEYRWYDGETRTIFSHPVTQVFGQRIDSKQVQSVGDLTNVGYFSLPQIFESIGKKWKQMGVSNQQAQNTVDSLKKTAPGGYAYLYIERYDEDRANLKYFFMIIRDKNDKTLYAKYFNYQSPQIASGKGTWWNYIVTEIPVELEYPFYIYINDKQSEFLSDFKFRIDAISHDTETDVEIIDAAEE
jgi:hypothetical protein